jgi:GT2 family glycosyltransferase
MFTDSVAFPGYTREILERAGPFNEQLVRNQDDEYNYRIRKLGGRILLSPAITSRYYSRSTFRSLWRQYFQYGYWKVRVLQLHPKQMSLRQFVPFFFVLGILVLAVLSLFLLQAFWILIMLLVVYFVANLFASVSVSRSKLNLLAYLPISFLILHVSYGLGSMTGLVAFRKYWSEKKRLVDRDGKVANRISEVDGEKGLS